MSSLPTVLICTYPEHGQANVNLATAYELALAGANVHFASFASLRSRVDRLQELIDRHALRSSGKPTGCVVFHECKGITPNWEAQARHGVNDANLPHPCGVVGAVQGYSKIGAVLYHWSQEEYLAVIAVVKEIIATTKPDVVVVDPLFFAAQDACKLTGQKLIIMSPTGLKESGAMSVQPNLAVFWKYPMSVAKYIFSPFPSNSYPFSLASGFSYPLKWWQIILNIYLFIRLITISMNSVTIKQTHALRKSLGLKALGYTPQPGVPFICPAIPEIDYPLAIIPEEMVLCGPIITPFDPLEESDPALMKWLDNGPTVLINLGSHVVANENLAREMVSAFRILLDYHDKKGGPSKIQVLWKVKADGDIQRTIDEIVGKEIKEGRIKVVAWLDTEPVSILQHPNVVCTVHHGGANSFYEGIW